MSKVSIIIPTYNRAGMICRTLQSIVAQTFDDFECLILDDGSTDNTEDIIQQYLADDRIKYFFHQNIGEAETVNRGWKLASGEYFTQVNSDDPVYPNFLEVMVKALEANPEKILAYPDFDFIDAEDKIIKTTRGRPWDFLRNLSEYSCEAACPGTMFRCSALSDIVTLKRKGFLHINDTEMYWNLALRGDFLHVPHVLTTWRQHDGQISTERYKSIPECEEWFKQYFSQSDLPHEVQRMAPQTRKSMCAYFISLLEQSCLPRLEKRKLCRPYQAELGITTYEFSCLQVGDQDLIGGKFNGHMLHKYLHKNNIETYHYVCIKQSHDDKTYILDNLGSTNFFNSLILNKKFIDSDILHLHLMHNTNFDLLHLPFISQLKPIVWTLHDPWVLGGHCIYHGGCSEWKNQCIDCKHKDIPFAISRDTSTLEFEIKRYSIQNSNISGVVASKFMYDKVKESPIWKDKKIYFVPFGVDQNIFYPADAQEARKKLGISEGTSVLFARTQQNFKGLEVLREAINSVGQQKQLTLLTVGQKELLDQLPSNVSLREYGWVDDDAMLAMLYQASDLFLMPSEQEAFGMMAIEAMSCGKMVLALDSPTSALPSVINSPYCGVAVNKEMYTQELSRLLNNHDEIAARGRKSLEFAKNTYSITNYVNRLIEIYQEEISSFHISRENEILQSQIRKNFGDYPCVGFINGVNSITNTISDDIIYKMKNVVNYYKNFGALATGKKIKSKILKKYFSKLSRKL